MLLGTSPNKKYFIPHRGMGKTKTQFTGQYRKGASGIIQILKLPMFIFQTAFISMQTEGKVTRASFAFCFLGSRETYVTSCLRLFRHLG